MHFIANLRQFLFAILILSRPQFGSRVIDKVNAQDCSFSPCAKRVYNWSRHYDVIKLTNPGRGIRVSVRLGDWSAPFSRILTCTCGGLNPHTNKSNSICLRMFTFKAPSVSAPRPFHRSDPPVDWVLLLRTECPGQTSRFHLHRAEWWSEPCCHNYSGKFAPRTGKRFPVPNYWLGELFVCNRLANLTHRGLTSSSDIACQAPRGIKSGVVPATSENSLPGL